MSFKKRDLFPCNPGTVRGEATRISSSKDKIAYTNGRTVIVRICERFLDLLIHTEMNRFAI